MKKSLLFVLGLFVFGFVLADNQKGDAVIGSYNPDPNSGNVVPAFNFYAAPSTYGAATSSITIFANYEMPMIDPNLTLGPEVGIGVGGSLNGISSSTIIVSVKATYYADWLIPNMPDQFDVFLSSTAGLYMSMGTSSTFGAHYGNYIGGRWNFTENMSVYAQVGHGNSFVAGGISFKF